jgi:DNA-binding MurR/RpiR family transcriptional regulator
MIHVVGQRRSFPIAAYLAYGLSQLGRPARLVDGLGGMLAAQSRLIAERDVLLAISFRDYAPEVVDMVHQTRALGAPIVAITDSPLSPLAPASTVCFEVQDVAVDGFRSLAASMCLAQALVIGLGARLEQRAFRRRSRRKGQKASSPVA